MRKAILIFALILLSVFLIGHKASAFSNFSAGTGYFSTQLSGGITNKIDFTPVGGSITNIFSGGSRNIEIVATTTASSTLGHIKVIKYISLLEKNPTGSSKAQRVIVDCTDGTGTHSGASDYYSIPASTVFLPQDFILTSTITCDTDTLVKLFIQVIDNNAQDFYFAGNDVIGLTEGIGISDNQTTENYNYNFIFGINSPFNSSTTNTTELNGSVACSRTRFTLVGLDFGEALCEITKTLFVPSQNSLTNFANIATTTQQTIPFSYFYDIKDAVYGQSTTSTATPVSFDLVASTTSFGQIHFTPFSTSTAVAYMGQTNYDLFQLLMRYAILAAFGFYLYFRITHLLHPK